MIRYKTVNREASAERIVEKSKFIAHVKPVSTKEEADGFISEIRTLHRMATHNVPAMVIGDKFQVQWASDDGEPQGTSGAPIVQMIVKEGITNVAVVVTRYFGGIKLGTGGLVRAYTSAAKQGIEQAGICAVKDMSMITVRLPYPYLSKLQNLSVSGDFEIRRITYEELVTLEIATEPECLDQLTATLGNVSSGKCEIVSKAFELVKIALEK